MLPLYYDGTWTPHPGRLGLQGITRLSTDVCSQSLRAATIGDQYAQPVNFSISSNRSALPRPAAATFWQSRPVPGSAPGNTASTCSVIKHFLGFPRCTKLEFRAEFLTLSLNRAWSAVSPNRPKFGFEQRFDKPTFGRITSAPGNRQVQSGCDTN